MSNEQNNSQAQKSVLSDADKAKIQHSLAIKDYYLSLKVKPTNFSLLKERIWILLNSSFFLWFISAILLSTLTSYLSDRQNNFNLEAKRKEVCELTFSEILLRKDLIDRFIKEKDYKYVTDVALGGNQIYLEPELKDYSISALLFRLKRNIKNKDYINKVNNLIYLFMISVPKSNFYFTENITRFTKKFDEYWKSSKSLEEIKNTLKDPSFLANTPLYTEQGVKVFNSLENKNEVCSE